MLLIRYNPQDRHSARHRSIVTLTLMALFSSFMVLTGQSPAMAAPPPAQAGMPFTGQWAYNADVSPPYTDSNSSHPSVHHVPGGGDWGTDLYAPAGTAVKLRVTSSGALTFSWRATTNGTCGRRTQLNVFVDGVHVGWLYYEHLSGAVKSGAITNGMTLGTVANAGACNAGPHIHVEFKNATNYACYTDNGRPGVKLSEGAALGMLGSANTGAKQACASSTPTTADTSFTGVGDAQYFGSDRLVSGQVLRPGQYLLSWDGRFVFLFQSDPRRRWS